MFPIQTTPTSRQNDPHSRSSAFGDACTWLQKTNPKQHVKERGGALPPWGAQPSRLIFSRLIQSHQSARLFVSSAEGWCYEGHVSSRAPRRAPRSPSTTQSRSVPVVRSSPPGHCPATAQRKALLGSRAGGDRQKRSPESRLGATASQAPRAPKVKAWHGHGPQGSGAALPPGLSYLLDISCLCWYLLGAVLPELWEYVRAPRAEKMSLRLVR